MDEYLVKRETFDNVMMPNYAPQAMIPVRGKGSRIWDQMGNEYIDFAGGIAVSALGHCHPDLVNALQNQSNKLWHLSNVFTNEPALKLAQRLTQSTFADKVFFCNSGTEANEAAFKLARKYAFDTVGAEKNEIIACNSSFHGRSLFSVAVGGQPKYREGFAPLPEGIRHVPFNDLDSLEQCISDKICAVVIEPIQGEGGVKPATLAFLEGARALCNQHNALLIFDEVQTGMGRTGYLYAYMYTGVIPDILTTAKALGAGFPIGATLASNKVADSFSFGSHGSTYGGNPLACSVALEAFNIINDEQLLAEIPRKHNKFTHHLSLLNEKYNLFNDIRGKGLLIGAELKGSWQGKAKNFLAAAASEGVMLLVAGPNILRIAPSLIIPDEDIQQGMEKLEKAIAKIVKRQ
ncbi:MAG: aspartate aminotransferase family protein [Endozoicomonas sp. (ex Botrylloides leachii)]|nr:aspartate aminotransferase family protein [Endozoicomonas sp. (ex Botrylloides leachii)]